ncbi:MAG: amino acid adenylation domain-containing protein, partial [Spirochaetaceae bacterium]|nr:amino acid adenylation domain-containing protein [Spirochaetaceae bacterium]
MSTERILYPLTNAQQRIWNTEKLYPGTSVSNLSAEFIIGADINIEILKKAIKDVVLKNEGLHLRLILSGEEVKQYISKVRHLHIEVVDFRSGTDPQKAIDYFTAKVQIPFVLDDTQLFEFNISKCHNGKIGVFAKIHHIISDGWTFIMLFNQIKQYYDALICDQNVSLEKSCSYLDYITSEKSYIGSEQFESSKEFFNKKFSHLPEFFNFPIKYNDSRDLEGSRKRLYISQELRLAIELYCKEMKISVLNFFLTLLFIYFNKVTQKRDMVLGTVTHGRLGKSEKNMAGMFVNTYAIRETVTINETAAELMKRITAEIKDMFKHHKYPYNLLIRDLRPKLKKSNLIEVLFNNRNINTSWPLGSFFSGYESFPLLIRLCEHIDSKSWELEFDYRTAYFNETDIDQIFKHCLTLIKDIIGNPQKKISQLDLLSREEKHHQLVEFNQTKVDFPKDKTIHELFETQVKRSPDSIAVIFGDKTLTYGELNEKSNSLARLLRKKGVVEDTIVGLLLDRSLEMIIAIFAVLKSGGAYLPLATDNPLERIDFLLDDSGSKLLLSTNNYFEKLHFDGEIIDMNSSFLYQADISNLNLALKPENLVYIIYTSGSTGKPKGVMVEHRNVVNLLYALLKRYQFTNSDTFLLKTAYSFDVSIFEIFGYFLGGGRLAILAPDEEKNPRQIVKAMVKHSVSYLTFVPSMLDLFLTVVTKEDADSIKTLKYVISAGEALKAKTIDNFFDIMSQYKIENLYGPTETTVYSTWSRLSDYKKNKKIPIGKPISNITLYIVDKTLNLLPLGLPGELCISGIGLARGYLNRPELTEEKFVNNPFVPGTRMYRTGDLAKWLPDGNIEYLGRIDNQVKIRGFRVELGEIEAQLLNHPAINQAIVTLSENIQGGRSLVAYLVARADLDISFLKKDLGQNLPDYMIPAHFVFLHEMPLNSNGKTDRKALPEVNRGSRQIINDFIAPRNITEEAIAQVWHKKLCVDKIGIDDDFYDLGGDSLQIVECNYLLSRDYNLKAESTFQFTTIRELAKLLKENQEPLSHKFERIKADFPAERVVSPENREFIDKMKSYNRKNKDFYLKNVSKKKTFNHILLTGATGFLGVHLCADLLESGTATIYLLIRAVDLSEAENRVKQKLSYYFDDSYYPSVAGRIKIIVGDISEEKLALSDSDFRFYSEKIDCVINSAANTKHYGSYDDFYKVNCGGVKNLIDFSLNGA